MSASPDSESDSGAPRIALEYPDVLGCWGGLNTKARREAIAEGHTVDELIARIDHSPPRTVPGALVG